jgi:hypothetical protein
MTKFEETVLVTERDEGIAGVRPARRPSALLADGSNIPYPA